MCLAYQNNCSAKDSIGMTYDSLSEEKHQFKGDILRPFLQDPQNVKFQLKYPPDHLL